MLARPPVRAFYSVLLDYAVEASAAHISHAASLAPFGWVVHATA